MGISKTALLLAVFCISLSILNSVSGAPGFFDEDDDDSTWDSDSEETPEEISRSLDNHDHHKGLSPDSSDNIQKLTNNGNEDGPLLGASFGGSGAQNPPPQVPYNNGGNIAGYNESCGGSLNRICNTVSRLECSRDNRCVCMVDHAYIPREEACYRIPKGDENCEYNEQCHAATHGKHSRCNHQKGVCECYDNQQSGKRELVLKDGTCYIKRNYNGPCEIDAECRASIHGEAYCATPDPNAPPHWANATQVCLCKPGYVYHPLLNACFKIADQDLASDCKQDLQCQESLLGAKSKCGLDTGKCQCHDPANPGEMNVVFYKPRRMCFSRKNWNDTCTEDDECRASISSKAQCLVDNVNGDFSNPKTCQCPEGVTCPLDADGGAFGLVPNTFNLVILVVSVFVGKSMI